MPRDLDAFLAAVTSDARPIIGSSVLVVVAHPDDETLGCGALLPRLAAVAIVHVTDGAPRDGRDATRAGYRTPAAYATARRRELVAALAIADVGPDRLRCFDVADQSAAREIAPVALRLRPLVAEADFVLTHAYEGGHPDHDAVSVAVWAAAALLGESAPPVVAMPFYRANPDGPGALRQSFGPNEPASVLRLTPAERERKAAMLACFASQAETLGLFGAADEAFRRAALPDLGDVSDGRALYDEYGWELTSVEFRRLARAALAELGLGGPA